MRLAQAAIVARMLLVFFRRRALAVGALRLPSVRIGIVVAALAFAAITTTAGYLFLRDLVDQRRVWDLLFDVTTVSVVLGVIIAFLFVKVLFMHADGILELTYQLPVTNRERSLAVLLYEASLTGIVAVGAVLALLIDATLLLGRHSITPILLSIVVPAVLTYLVLALVHNLLTRLWVVLGLGGVSAILNVLAVFGVAVVYSSLNASLVGRLADAYLDENRADLWVTSVRGFADRFGAPASLLASLAACALLATLVVLLSPGRHVRPTRYTNVRGPWTRRLTPYDLCALRSTHALTGAALALALALYLFSRGTSPLWALSLLTIGGLYQFTATAPLRALPGPQVPPGRTLLRLLRGQLVVVALACPPLAALHLVDHRDVPGLLLPLAAAAGAAILTTCLGIIFPSEKDNPLSVFVGLATLALAAGFVALTLGLLELGPLGTAVAAVCAIAALTVFALGGIHQEESRSRHETHDPGRRLARGGRGPHDRRRRSEHAVADVRR